MSKFSPILKLCRIAILVVIGLQPYYALAQDDIFVPVDPSQEQTAQPSKPSPLSRWVALDAGLYDVALQYDAQIRIAERAERQFEPAYLRNYEHKMLNPESTDNVYTPSEWGYYSTLMHEPTACNQLDKALAHYISKNSAELDATMTQLIAETKDFTEEQKAQMAQTLRTAFAAAVPNKRRAQEILYFCLHRFKNEIGVQKPYSMEKTLKNWFIIEARLLDEWLGPVD